MVARAEHLLCISRQVNDKLGPWSLWTAACIAGVHACLRQWTEILTTKATVSKVPLFCPAELFQKTKVLLPCATCYLMIKVQLTAHEIVGLRAEVGYEVSVPHLASLCPQMPAG